MAAAEVEAVDFEPDEDDLMDEDGAVDVDVSPVPQPLPKLRSTITGGRSTYAAGEPSGVPRKTKGTGFREVGEVDRNNRLAAKDFESVDSDGTQSPQLSIGGWIILVTGVHEDAEEVDIMDVFGVWKIKNLHLNPDRRTGFVKGYALIEYEKYEEARAAIEKLNGFELHTQAISVDWAFSKGPFRRRNLRRRCILSKLQCHPVDRGVPGGDINIDGSTPLWIAGTMIILLFCTDATLRRR